MKIAEWGGTLRVGLVVAALAGLGGSSSGSTLKTGVAFSTSGTIDGPNSPVVFHGVGDGTYTPSTPFSLGTFEVIPQAAGGGTRHIYEPFSITYQTLAIFGVTPKAGSPPVVLHGVLSGVINDDGSVNVRAMFDQGGQMTDPNYYNPQPAPPFVIDGWINTISVNGTKEFLSLSGTAGDLTTIQGQIDMVQVPEPGSLAVFGMILAAAAAAVHGRRRARAG